MQMLLTMGTLIETISDMTQPEIAIIIFVVFLCFADEIEVAVHYLYLQILLARANLNLYIRSYLLYRKLKSGMDKHGLDIPPFKFTPIQKRQ